MPVKLEITTRKRTDWVAITSQVADAVRQAGVTSGVVTVFVPHTTAGVTINENADPDVARDMMGFLDRFVPQSAEFAHAEGNSDAHIKASLMGSSVRVIVEDGRLCLGTWQGIYFCDFDGPRRRQVWLALEGPSDATASKEPRQR